MEEKRIGVYVCWCGSNIAKMVDVEAVTKEVEKFPNVVIAKNYKYMCSDPGQELIVNDIKKHNLNRVVVSACSPRIHELTFRKALENAGLNPYLFQMANIREQVSWVHTDRDEATRKAVDLVLSSVKRVNFHEPLEKRTVDINPATLVIGGGISGMTSALEIADAGKKVFLIEKSDKLGGHCADIDLSYPLLGSVDQIIQQQVKRVTNHPNIEVYLNTPAEEIYGYVGNFEKTIKPDGKEVKLQFGNVVVASGLKTFDPSGIDDYGYGKLSNVITSVEFEKMLKQGKIETKEGKTPENIAIIHCVGSRNSNYHDYCSRICCQVALKYSNQIRSALPDANIFELYADMRAFGKGSEEFYCKTHGKDVMMLMFDQRNDLPKISKAPAGDTADMIINANEQLSGENIDVPADLVVLMVGMEAQEDAKDIAHYVGVSMCGNDFYIEKHPKLDPVATTTDGVYIVGACQGPKDVIDSVAQAKGAAARILGTITRGQVEVESTTAEVNEDLCCGCQTCIKVCPYTAISFDEEKGVSVVNEVLCKGCGTCGSACPTGAIKSKHFTDDQLLSQIEGLMLIEA